MVPKSLFCVLLLIQVGSLAIIGAKADTSKCNYQMDLAFVVDSSGSICNNTGKECDDWRSLRTFIHNLVDSMTIGKDDARVAMIVFQTSAWIRWNLTTYSDKASLLRAIDNLRYTDGTTNTIAALDLLSTVFSAEAGDRPDVMNQAILITDGKPQYDYYVYSMDEIRPAVKRVTDKGIRLLAVGVTNDIDMNTLKELSSKPRTINETVFIAKDYKDIGAVLKQLEVQICTNITEPQQFIAEEPAKCTEKLDLCFVVDASGSICDDSEGFDYNKDETCNNWKNNVEFISSIVNTFDIGLLGTRIGLIVFSSTAAVRWKLTTYTDKSALQDAIKSLTYRKGGRTDMTGGLRLMRTQVFGLSDDRPDAPNTAIIITDGYPTDPSTLQGEIDACRQSGIRTLVVGVTDKIDLNAIRRLASPPSKENETYFLSRDYATLKESVRAQLSAKTCLTPTAISKNKA